MDHSAHPCVNTPRRHPITGPGQGGMNMKTMTLAIATILLGTGGMAQAQSGLSRAYTACTDRAGSNIVQSGMCAQTEIVAQDARLNKAYKQVMGQLASNPTRRTALRDRQRSWLKARDYQCNIDGGTFDMNCVVERTAERADQLEGMVRF